MGVGGRGRFRHGGVGLIGQTISRQDPDTLKRVKAAYDDLAREFAGPDGRLRLRYHALLAGGRAV